ncbi:MAG: dihydrofolate reductase, partial [Cyclobacteriaceae bacterium]|nr:dihydrofolate reductase [Cyclobacteriaceae bacterium]
PEIDKDTWKEISREEHKADEKNKYDFAFVEYVRKN